MKNKIKNIMKNTTNEEKMFLFYEIANYILKNNPIEDGEENDFLGDVANIVNDLSEAF